VSPSVAAATRLSDRVRIRASVDRGLRAPTWTERFYMDPANIGNPDLVEERFWAAELGLTAVAASSLSLDIATFIRRAENLIDWARPAGADESEVWVTTNIENATFRGIEITAAARRLLGADWSLRASVLDFSDDEADGYTSKYALRPITRSVSLHASFAITTDLALTARALDARRHGDDAFQRFDTRLAWSRGRTTLYFDATNIGDSQPLDVAGQPSAGRAFAIGLRLGGPAGR
jgi:iron complex outermembrane receptor protein